LQNIDFGTALVFGNVLAILFGKKQEAPSMPHPVNERWQSMDNI